MTLEIREVSQKEFEEYWTPAVCELMNKYVYETKWWASDFDGDKSKNKEKWVIDVDGEISFISVAITRGISHPSDITWEDVAVVSRDGSIGLLKHLSDESSNDVYKIMLLTGNFDKNIDDFKSGVIKAIGVGGLRLNGSENLLNQVIDIKAVKFIDERSVV